MKDDPVFKSLKTPIQKAGKTSPSYIKRVANIKWVKNLPRDGLVYNSKEKQVLIKQTSESEEVYIQYPGKESAEILKNGIRWSRPWDFRPKLFNKTKAAYYDDLSFDALWVDLENKVMATKEKDSFRILSVLLYRIAYMVDHAFLQKETLRVNLLDKDKIIQRGTYESGPRYVYSPDEHIIDDLSKTMPAICGMPLKSFLYYLDLLAWNEDCKYYYGKIESIHTTKWLNATGRVNTLLTILHFLGLLLGEIKYSHLFSKFAKFGISGVREQDIFKICGGLIK